MHLNTWRRLQVFLSRIHLASYSEWITLWSLLLVRRCGQSKSTLIALDNDWHFSILALKELLKTPCWVFSQAEERGGSFIFVTATVWKLGSGCHEIEILAVLSICQLLNHEGVPTVLCHELTPEILLVNSLRAECGWICTLLFLTIAHRLKTHVSRTLRWVLRKHSF